MATVGLTLKQAIAGVTVNIKPLKTHCTTIVHLDIHN